MTPGAATDLLVTCGGCHHEFRVATSLAGRSVPFPHCNAMVAVAVAATASPPDPLIGQVVAECRLTRRLGAGGIGLVYAAVQNGTNRPVAVKLLGARAGADQVLVERFRREAQLQAALDHPHVVKAYAAGFERGAHYLVMEMVDGGTLSGLVDQRGRLPWPEACLLVAHIARAMEALHAQGIIHRDLKPANILVARDREGRPVAKLADLGLAKDLEGDIEPGMSLTLEGKPLGTPAYIAPEQIRDAKGAGRPADVYGLGATLYSALTGGRPYEGTTPMMVMAGVLKGPPPDPRQKARDLPPAVVEIVQVAMAREPHQRPTAAALAERLETLVSGAGTAAWRQPSTSTIRRPGTGVHPRPGVGATTPSSAGQRPGTGPVVRVGSGAHPRPGSASHPRPGTAPFPRPGEPATAPMVRPVTTSFRRPTPAPGRPESAVWQDAPAGLPGWAVAVLVVLGVAMLALIGVLAFA
jgi:serine/threonine protein kinase